MLLFQPLLKKYFPTPPAPQNQPAQNQPAQTASPSAPSATSKPVAPPTGGVTKQTPRGTLITIENDLYRITFTNRGAEVKSWILKKYDNETEKRPCSTWSIPLPPSNTATRSLSGLTTKTFAAA